MPMAYREALTTKAISKQKQKRDASFLQFALQSRTRAIRIYGGIIVYCSTVRVLLVVSNILITADCKGFITGIKCFFS